jgi:serpin B
MKALLLSLFLAVLPGVAAFAAAPAADAINALGIDLLHQQPAGNALLSPYSIQRVMAMAFAGADGRTREEMARVLHFPDDQSQVDVSFQKLQAGLGALMQRAAEEAKFFRQTGRTNEPLTLNLADRLFGQQGYDFRPEFLTLLDKTYEAPFEPLDFLHHPETATEHINHWVAVQTRDRIQNLIPLQDSSTRLVLVNTIYLKAPWMQPFSPSLDFRVKG